MDEMRLNDLQDEGRIESTTERKGLIVGDQDRHERFGLFKEFSSELWGIVLMVVMGS